MTSSKVRGLAAVCGLWAGMSFAAEVQASETRGFVVDWFHLATLSGQESCPTGLNPLSDVFYKRDLRNLGYSAKEVEELLKDFPNGAYLPIITKRGRVDGKPVNIYAQPWTQPDPGIKIVEGKRAYGFNLDGKDGPSNFVEPVTGEKGIDNQLYRAVGCTQSHTGALPHRPGFPQTVWDLERDYMPAWLIEVSGIDDFKNDDDVTVGFYRARSPVKRDASGDVRADMTMWVDPDPRLNNVAKARIKNGIITTDPITFRMVGNPMVMAEFDMRGARMRFELTPDGNLQGILGGYQLWETVYFGTFAAQGWATEHSAGVDMPAVYYALKRLADATPDAKGQNTEISGTYWIESVPAFIKHSSDKTAQVAK
ncbi:MAG: hypothetical protein K2P94_07890 [Rhodospirillaceae bacterium]|nr:hypothetical protein [Rhodospirillaceae bacterium]